MLLHRNGRDAVGPVLDVDSATMPNEPELVVVPDEVWDSSVRRALARDAAAGRRVRVRRAVYAEADEWAAAGADVRAVSTMHALDRTSRRRPLFSHWSAALLHGLPVPTSRLARTHVTVPAQVTRGLVGVSAHRFDIEPEDVTQVQGLLCATVARTVIDVAGSAPFVEGVVVADAALHQLGEPGRATVESGMRRALPRRAALRIADVVAFADGRSESVGESVSRCSMRAARLPRPDLQHDVFRDGIWLARVDFWFPEEGVVGEMDGRGKYLDPAMNGGDPGLAVWREKRREDRIRSVVRGVVRWSWEEARSPRALAALLAQAGVLPRS